MAYYRFYPRQQPECQQRDIFADAILSGLSQGMNQFSHSFGPYHRSTPYWGPCGGAEARRERAHQTPQGRTTTGRTPTDQPRRPQPNTPEAWVWWMLGGGDDSSESEDETTQVPPASTTHSTRQRRPDCRGRPCSSEEHCAMKRKPSRSVSNQPPSKKKDEVKPTEKTPTEKFNFTGKKTTEKAKVEAKMKPVTNSKEKSVPVKNEPEIVFVRRAPWRHVVKLDSDLGPEDVRVYVRDARIRVEGRKERNVGGNDDVIECLEVNRELVVPDDVILDDLSVYFRSGGRLELEAPRKIQYTTSSPDLVKNLEKMSVVDIEKDALVSESGNQDDVEENTEKEKEEDNEEKEAEREETSEVGEDENTDQKEEQNDDWEMVREEKNNGLDERNTENMEADADKEVSEDVEEKLEEAAEEKEQNEDQENVKISEIEEIKTAPIVEEPRDVTTATKDDSSIVTETPSPSNLVVRVVSEEQQQKQIEENTQLLVMNLAGFEPRDVTVEMTSDDESRDCRVSVKAVRVQEQDGFISRKENYRSFRVPNHLQGAHLTCTMGPEGHLVITAPGN